MIAKGIPGKLADDAMVLMQIVPIVREHQIWVYPFLKQLEVALDLFATIGEKALLEFPGHNSGLSCIPKKPFCAGNRFPFPWPLRTEHHPCYDTVLVRPQKLQDRPSAANLDIIGMRA